ncbi:ABC transporter ATP-binding protein [Halobiforma nitratireducens]|uniref:Sulfate-transporting ATPase n=1 Tax=Halobiforma nitratireducens JCM 10879 TaxID=1227454 RepID=M0L761_9EURY|nr:ABC transporter ATP-binding protein [Halobiforma nitratireducens]EMA29427.1 sulfate-transporting ATPase [Halobiforma nitratireducens JCM 10879]
MAILEVEGVRKEYDGFTAVEGSSFAIERGEVFGVVGPNGAGKTTTLKMLAGLVEPTAGTAVVAGYTPGERAMQRTLGFLPEESPLYEEMTAVDYLEFFADLYDVPDAVAAERIESSLDRLELEHRERRIGNMSKGMKRKVAIARALINDPEVLIFDEPASGLDPLTTNHVIEFTEELSEEGKTVVFSAHNLFHVESVCDRVVIMNDGRIVARGSLDEIRDEHGGTEYHVYATVDGSDGLEDGHDGRVETDVDETGSVRHVVADMDAVDAIRETVEARDGRVTDIQTETPSLEDIFLEVAGGTEPDAERRRDDGDGTGRSESEPDGGDDETDSSESERVVDA